MRQGTPAQEIAKQLLTALSVRDRVSGLTHCFYRYPARFPPTFARSAIQAFSDPGDVILDPFVGGGTTAVEAIAAGRRFVGTDLNELAVFVTKAKTTLLPPALAPQFVRWAQELEDRTREAWLGTRIALSEERHIPWTIRRTLSLALQSLNDLPNARLRTLAKASILRVGQWALDGRRRMALRGELLQKHRTLAAQMVQGSLALGDAATAAFGGRRAWAESQRRVTRVAAETIASSSAFAPTWQPPRLIVTSPPYHGVHILYHRWQVDGRRETPARPGRAPTSTPPPTAPSWRRRSSSATST